MTMQTIELLRDTVVGKKRVKAGDIVQALPHEADYLVNTNKAKRQLPPESQEEAQGDAETAPTEAPPKKTPTRRTKKSEADK